MYGGRILDGAYDPGTVFRTAFKRTTAENWLDPDPRMSGEDGREWIAQVNGLKFDMAVPDDVCEAFVFATGAIGYAYFYGPILTLVSHQVLRVADFALDRFFDRRGIEKPRTFGERLQRLKNDGLLSGPEYNRWDGIRRLRNAATHPDFQDEWNPAMSLQMIRAAVTAISALPWEKR